MRAYDLFPGAAREDDLVAVVAYNWEDYRKIFNGTVGDYKNFLLERKDFIVNSIEQHALRVVEIHWDEEFYKEWRKKVVWPDNMDAHGAWALDTAKDREKMQLLREKYPALPAAPLEEEITAEVSYAIVPYIAGSDEAMRKAGRKLPEKFLREILAVLRAKFVDLPFNLFSSRRGEGVMVLVGNSFITPDWIDELAESFIDSVPKLAVGKNKDILEDGILSISRQMRLRKTADEYPVLVILLFPVILVGAAREVGYAADYLQKGIVIGPLINMLEDMLTEYAPEITIDGTIPVVPWDLTEGVVSEMLDQMDKIEQIDDEEENSGGGPNLRRIK